VVGKALVPPPELRAVDGRPYPVPPRRTQQQPEELLLQLVDLVVVAIQLGRPLGVGGLEHSGDLLGHPVGGLRHVLDHRPQLLRYGNVRDPPQGRLRHVVGQVAHPFQVAADV
jgi:hypothetical protein